MINERIDDLFNAIKDSSEYKNYLEIGKLLDNDDSVKDLVEEIKSLQQESVKLEYNNDLSYKEIDKIIEEKVNILNSKPIYKEYLNRMNSFNDILSESSNSIEKYINSKV